MKTSFKVSLGTVVAPETELKDIVIAGSYAIGSEELAQNWETTKKVVQEAPEVMIELLKKLEVLGKLNLTNKE